MPDTSRTESRGILAHPLILLLVGTALSSWLIPAFSGRIQHAKLIGEARLRKATEIINDNAETERNLNSLLTTLGIFQKDSSGPAARFLRLEKEQKELRGQMIVRYLEFDRQAWWWNSQLDAEAKILEIASREELTRLEQISREYNENLEKSTNAVDIAWNAFLRQDYKPSDAGNAEILNHVRAKLSELNKERSRLVMEEAQIFTVKR